MNIEKFRNYCLSLDYVTEDMPFDQSTLVFRVGGKMFALTNIDSFNFVNLKCEPEKAIQLREQFEGIQPGYHMNKKHWNSVKTDGSISDNLFLELTKNSYDLIFSSLTKKVKNELLNDKKI